MKKFLSYSLSLTLLGLLFLVSCHENDNVSSSKHVVLDKQTESLIKSSAFAEFKENFPNEFEYVNYSGSQTNQLTSDIKTISLPIEKDGKLKGIVVGLILPNGKGYRIVYKNYSRFNEQGKGVIELYTAKRNFVVDFDTEVKGTKVIFKINHIGNNKMAALRMTTTAGVELPNPKDPWVDCVGECYKALKEACSDDPTCNFECDLLNFVNSCDASFMLACVAYCR